jgi:hypothetical protein
MKRYEQDYEAMEECAEGEWVKADEAMGRIAELERERDEARALVKEIVESDGETFRHTLIKCHIAVKRWEALSQSLRRSP